MCDKWCSQQASLRRHIDREAAILRWDLLWLPLPGAVVVKVVFRASTLLPWCAFEDARLSRTGGPVFLSHQYPNAGLEHLLLAPHRYRSPFEPVTDLPFQSHSEQVYWYTSTTSNHAIACLSRYIIQFVIRVHRIVEF